MGGVLVSSQDRLLCIGNPVEPSGKFFDLFKRSEVKKIHISAMDTPNVASGKDLIQGLCSKEWVDDKRKQWGEGTPLWQSRVLGEFPDIADNVLVPLHWITMAHERYEKAVEKKLFSEGNRHLGVDVARLGSDYSMLTEYVEGVGVESITQLRKQETMATCGEIINAVKQRHFTTVNVDADGLGAGVFDRLNEVFSGRSDVLLANAPESLEKSGLNGAFPTPIIRSIHGGHRPKISDRFLNFRAEAYWDLRERLDPSGANPIALPLNDRLTNQLSSIKWRLNSRGQIQIESKDEMRKRGMQSPDEADSVVYALCGQTRFVNFVLV